jgi:hypothetical protein
MRQRRVATKIVERGYLLMGYSNDAEHFDEQLAAFRDLVLRMRPLDAP